MHRLKQILFFLLLATIAAQGTLAAAIAPTLDQAQAQQSSTLDNQALANQASINLREDNNRAIAEKLGRKLSLKEKIAFSVIRGKLRKAERKASAYDPSRRDGLPVASLVLGILSILGLGIFFFLPLLAVIFGATSLKRNRYVDQPRYNMAIWGIVLGGISLLFFLLAILVLFALLATL